LAFESPGQGILKTFQPRICFPVRPGPWFACIDPHGGVRVSSDINRKEIAGELIPRPEKKAKNRKYLFVESIKSRRKRRNFNILGGVLILLSAIIWVIFLLVLGNWSLGFMIISFVPGSILFIWAIVCFIQLPNRCQPLMITEETLIFGRFSRNESEIPLKLIRRIVYYRGGRGIQLNIIYTGDNKEKVLYVVPIDFQDALAALEILKRKGILLECLPGFKDIFENEL